MQDEIEKEDKVGDWNEWEVDNELTIDEELSKIACWNKLTLSEKDDLRYFILQLLITKQKKLEVALNYNVDEPTKERILNALSALEQ